MFKAALIQSLAEKAQARCQAVFGDEDHRECLENAVFNEVYASSTEDIEAMLMRDGSVSSTVEETSWGKLHPFNDDCVQASWPEYSVRSMQFLLQSVFLASLPTVQNQPSSSIDNTVKTIASKSDVLDMVLIAA